MANKKKFWIFSSLALLLSGLMIFVIAMSVNGWDFNKLSTTEYQTNTHEISQDFSEILIDTNTADVVFLKATDGKTKVVCYEEESLCHAVQVENGKLTIRKTDTKKWHQYIGFHFESPKISVYLPQTAYASLSIETDTGDVALDGFTFEKLAVETDTGDIRLKNLSANAVNLSVETGDIELYNLTCSSLRVESDTGDVELTKVVANESFVIETDTGDVSFARCDAKNIFIETDTGDVEGTLLSGKSFTAISRTGDVEVPPSATDGRCEIRSDTGDIEIEIAK